MRGGRAEARLLGGGELPVDVPRPAGRRLHPPGGTLIDLSFITGMSYSLDLMLRDLATSGQIRGREVRCGIHAT